MKVLVFDDSSFVRQYLSLLVDKMGIISTEAEDGDAALHALKTEQKFELMLLEVNMPIIEGLECVKTLREARLQLEMNVLMVTTEVDNLLSIKALNHATDEFLMKPFAPEGFRKKIALRGLAAWSRNETHARLTL